MGRESEMEKGEGQGKGGAARGKEKEYIQYDIISACKEHSNTTFAKASLIWLSFNDISW